MPPRTARLAGLVAIAVGAFALAALKLPPRSAAPAGAFASAGGRFRATFPAPPREADEPLDGLPGRAVMAATPTGGCKVSYADLPPGESAAARLDAAVMRCEWPPTFSRPLSLDGRHPGREFWGRLDNPPRGRVRGRFYAAGGRLYRVVVIGTEKFAVGPEAEAFLDSFELVP